MSSEEEKSKEVELLEDIQKYSDIESVALSNGGKKIIKGLKKDIVSLISSIGSLAKSGASYNELVAGVIALDEKMNMLNIFINSTENKIDAKKIFEEITKRENPVPEENE